MIIVPIIEGVLAAAGVYLSVGFVFAALFAGRWAHHLDPQAGSGTRGFRLAIVPAAAALWPLLLLRLTKGGGMPPDAERPLRPEALRTVQTLAFTMSAVLAAAVAGVSLAVRPGQDARTPSPEPEAPAAGLRMEPFGNGLPAAVGFSGSDGSRRAELAVEGALAWPAAALFWSPTPVGATLPREAVLLGGLWGPAHLVFRLPAQGGWLAVADFADGGKVLAVRQAAESP